MKKLFFFLMYGYSTSTVRFVAVSFYFDNKILLLSSVASTQRYARQRNTRYARQSQSSRQRYINATSTLHQRNATSTLRQRNATSTLRQHNATLVNATLRSSKPSDKANRQRNVNATSKHRVNATLLVNTKRQRNATLQH